MERIRAPFTEEQVAKLNESQKRPDFHPFTCCSPEDVPECTRALKEVDGKIIEGTSDGLLKATKDGWVCPCGGYTQNWAYTYQLK